MGQSTVACSRNAIVGLIVLAGTAAVPAPATAIVIDDGLAPGQIVDTTNVTGIGQMVVDQKNGFIGLCTATLINPRTVVFASHCVNETPNATGFEPGTGYGAKSGGLPIGFFFDADNNQPGNSAIGHWLNGVGGGPKDLTRVADNAYNSNFVAYDTNCCTLGLGLNFLENDIALAALDAPAIGIPTWTMLFSPLAGPAHATIVGYGASGIGSTGQGTIDFKRRVAENIVSVLGSLDDQDTFLFGGPDGLPANLYMDDFNDPKFDTAQANAFDFNVFHDTATVREGITAPGDSGGPLIVDHQFAAPTIAAVLSGGDRFFVSQPGSSYGTTSFYQPLYLYWDWIVANNPYKYVVARAGDGSWTDVAHWQMALDPAYLTIDANGDLVNALPATPAQGAADVPPGFGEICRFDDCIDIGTGVHTNPTPPPAPNPAANCGPALFSAAALDDDSSPGTLQPACNPDATGISSGTSNTNSPQSDWLNPEGTAPVAGVQVQGAPGASPGRIIDDTDGDPATNAPARYYDVTLAAAGTTTLSGADITIDKLTVNGPGAALTIAPGASLTTLIVTNSFAGTTQVDGALISPNGVQMFGGVLQGAGTVNGDVSLLLGAVAPGTNGTIGTLTINGTATFSPGATTVIDVSGAAADLLKINGPATIAGTAVITPLAAVQLGMSHVFLTATGGITGAYDAAPDTLPGVLFPAIREATVGGVDAEVVVFQAGSFVALLDGAGTPDQTEVAAGLDAARGAHYDDLIALYQAIDPLSGDALDQALEDLAPDALRAAPLVGDMQTTAFDTMLWQHMAGMTTAGSDRIDGLAINAAGLEMALSSEVGTSQQSQQLLWMGQAMASTPEGGGDSVPAVAATQASPNRADNTGFVPLPAGANAFITGSSLAGSVLIGGGGGRADVRGLIIGAGFDFPVFPSLSLGGAFAYSDAAAKMRLMPASLQSDAIQGALYARYDFEGKWIAEAFASYGHQAITTRRVVVVGPAAFSLIGHTGGSSPSAGVYIGREFGIATLDGPTLSLTPSFSLQYVGTEVDAFTERGGAPAMHFAGFSAQSGLSRLGLDAHMTFDVFGGLKLTPNVHAFWVEDFDGNNGSIQAAFAGAPGAIMTFAIAARDRSYGDLGVGADLDMGEALGAEAMLSARYDANTRSDVQYGAWTGRLTLRF